MNGTELTKGIVITDFEPSRLSLVFQILRLLTNGPVGIEFVIFSDLRRPHDSDMVLEPAAVAKFDIRADDAIRSDLNISTNLG